LYGLIFALSQKVTEPQAKKRQKFSKRNAFFLNRRGDGMDERRRKRSGRHGAAVCAALVFALSALLVPAGAVSAPDPGGETRMLVPVGKAIGVKLFAEGVLGVGL